MELKSSTSDEGESNTLMLIRDLQCFHYYLPHHFSYYHFDIQIYYLYYLYKLTTI